jgi:hypothetical protein
MRDTPDSAALQAPDAAYSDEYVGTTSASVSRGKDALHSGTGSEIYNTHAHQSYNK